MQKNRLSMLSYGLIVAGIVDVFLRHFVHLEFMFGINDLLGCASATIFILAHDKGKWLCFLPFVIGICDEVVQYYNKYPEIFERLYSSTADIKDVAAYIVGFILSIILYKMEVNKHENKIRTNDH